MPQYACRDRDFNIFEWFFKNFHFRNLIHKILRHMYYLGLDIGSSSIKVALVEVATGKSVGVVQEPETEMEMLALKNGWAEQDPK